MNEEELFAAALELPSAERDDFLRRKCGDDEALRKGVEELLSLYESGPTLVDKPCEESSDLSLIELSGPQPDDSDLPELMPANGDTVVYFGDYQIDEEIARGAMGVVYRAEQTSLKRIVALKMIRGAFTLDDNEVARFRQEAESAASLDHPNIVPIYEIGEHEGQQYFSMKLISGGTLTDVRDSLKKDRRAAVELMTKVARAIHAAHQRGILHRDIKPGNILVDEAGEPHITDFGLSKQIESESALTVTGQIMGTPFFMAPEQAGAGSKIATTESDVYSLGAVLYDLLTGAPPHKAESILETLRLVVQEEPKSMRLADPSIDLDLDTIVLKCLEKDPNRRYPSAIVLAEELERWLEGEPILARPVGTMERLVKWAKRKPVHATAWGLAAGFLLTLGIGGPLVAVHQSELRKNAENAEAETRRKSEENRRNFYFAEMNMASQFGVTPGGIRRLRALTARWIPEPGEKDLRGWEWYYLDSLYRNDLLSFDRHEERVMKVAWSPGGERVASADAAGIVRLWDPDTGDELFRFDDHSGTVCRGVAWSPDGSGLVSCDGGGLIVVREPETGKIRWSLQNPAGEIRALGWRPNGRHIAFGCFNGEVHIRDASSGKVIQKLPGPGQAIYSLSWDFAGRRLVIGYGSLAAHLWEAPPGKILLDPAGEAPVRQVAWSPDGRWLAGEDAGGSRDLLLIDPASGNPVRRLKGHFAVVDSLAWSPDGSRLASASWDKSVRIWDPEAGEARLVIPATGMAWGLSWAPDGDRLAFGVGNRVRICDGRLVETPFVEIAEEFVSDALEWHPDGKRFVTGGFDGTVRIWDADSLKETAVFRGNRGEVLDVSWNADGSRVAAAGAELVVWNPNSDQEPLRFSGHASEVREVCWSVDGARIATAGKDNVIRVWDADTGAPIAELSRDGVSRFRYLAWSPDGKWLAAAAFTKGIHLWETDEFKLKAAPDYSGDVFGGIVWNAASDRVAVGTFAGEILVLDPFAGGVLLKSLGHESTVTGVAWSPDGSRIASAGSDRTIRIWDAATGAQCLAILAHDQMVNSLSWSPDGSRIASASRDGTIKIWDSQRRERADAELKSAAIPPVGGE